MQQLPEIEWGPVIYGDLHEKYGGGSIEYCKHRPFDLYIIEKQVSKQLFGYLRQSKAELDYLEVENTENLSVEDFVAFLITLASLKNENSKNT